MLGSIGIPLGRHSSIPIFKDNVFFFASKYLSLVRSWRHFLLEINYIVAQIYITFDCIAFVTFINFGDYEVGCLVLSFGRYKVWRCLCYLASLRENSSGVVRILFDLSVCSGNW